MKIILIIVVIVVLGMAFILKPAAKKANLDAVPKSFFELTIQSIEGETMKMGDYAGKYILCVNVASKCGFTPQYKPLQELYERYQDKLVVIGFPCNQFLGQEPGTEAQIAEFCEVRYGVTFPLTEKIKVKGKEQHPIYSWLTNKELNGVADAKIGWNFTKFLISPEGKWLATFPSKVDPLSEEITSYLQ